MAEFAVHALRSGGLVVDVQSDLLDPFETRVVIPLIAPEHAPRALAAAHRRHREVEGCGTGSSPHSARSA